MNSIHISPPQTKGFYVKMEASNCPVWIEKGAVYTVPGQGRHSEYFIFLSQDVFLWSGFGRPWMKNHRHVERMRKLNKVKTVVKLQLY